MLAATAFSVVVCATPAAAQLQTWNGIGNDFSDPANWTPGPVPGAGDTALFNAVTPNTSLVTGLDIDVHRIDIVTGAPSYTIDIGAFIMDIGRTSVGGGSGIFVTSAAPQFLVSNGGEIKFNNFSTISGDLTITNNGFGGVIRFLDNSSAGSAKINNDAASLIFQDNATAGNSLITNSNLMFFNDNARAGTATINNVAGVIDFNGFSSAQSATINNDFIVRFNADSTAGNAVIVNNGFAQLQFRDQSSAGNATISSTNGFIEFGSFGGFDTATAANATFNLNGSGLFFQGDTTAANATIIATNGSVVAFTDTANGGNARFIIDATSDLDFSFSAGPGGLGVVTAGSIEGAGIITLGGANTLFVVGSNNLSTEFSGVICECGGPAGLTKVGTGTLILSGDNTYTGATTIDGGTLQLGNGVALAGSVAGPIINNSILSVNRPDNFNLTSDISGGGIFNHIGTGNTTLSGNNIYTGPTNIIAGTLTGGGVNAFGNNSAVTVYGGAVFDSGGFNQTIGSLAGGGIVNLGGATLTIGGNNLSSNFAGPINGAGGALIKNGDGTLTLNGNNTYTGATTVNGGGLFVNGSIASSSGLTVNNATIGGNGIFPNTAFNGGTLSPGNSIGVINFNGSLTLSNTTVYAVELLGNTSDRVNITGTAGLAGSVVVTTLGQIIPGRFVILSAQGGRTGTFASVDSSALPPALRGTLTYTSTDAVLVVDAVLRNLSGLNRNQRAVSNAIDPAANAGGPIGAGLVTLLNLPGAALPGALSQVSGEVATGMQQSGVRAMDLFLGVMLNPFLHGRGQTGGAPALAFAPEQQALPRDAAAAFAASMPVKALPAATFGQRWNVWGSAYGGTSKSDGDFAIGSQNTRTDAYGFAAGADYRLSPTGMIGFALAGGGTNWSLSNGLGTGRSDMFQAGIYGSQRFGAAYISGAAAYTWHGASTKRNVPFLGVGQLDADFDAHSFGARLEGGYRWFTPIVGITPYGAAQVANIRTPGYSETGLLNAASVALSYGSRNVTATRTEVGLWFDKSFVTSPDAALTLRSRVAWAHDFNTDRQINATFQTLPGASFTVFGASPAPDFALLSGAAEMRLRNGWSFALKGDAEVASRTQTYSGTGVARYAW